VIRPPPLSQKPRVVLVSDSQEFYGAEHALTSLARGLAGSFDLVAVVGDRAAEETRRRLEAAGARPAVVAGLRYRCTPAGFVRLLRALHALEPELVHVHCTDQSGGLAPILAARLLRRRVVATLHLVTPGRRGWKRLVSAWALRRAHAVIAISDSIAEYLASIGIEATVVRYGISLPKQRADARESLSLPPKALVIGGLGRLHRQKGWDVLCRASALVAERVPEAAFVVIGDGPERDSLTRLTECSGVRFVGYREQAASFLSAFDLLVVPSRWEGFGRVATEAALARVPVVASRVDGLPEAVGDGGILVPPEQAEALAEALIALATEPARRAELSGRGERRARARFGVEREIGETRSVYRQVLA
jgi:glycosyltransferase involved in cell wall biosynthesis